MDLDSLMGAEVVGVKKKKKSTDNRKLVYDPILYKEGKPKITFLVDKVFSDKELRRFKNRMMNEEITDYQIVFPLKFVPTSKDLERDIVNTFANKKHDISKVIPLGSKVMTFGRTLFSITESNDLKVEGFQDLLLYHTYFYSPEYKANIYPVDSYQNVFFNDSPEAKFFGIQLDFIKEDKPPAKRQVWDGGRIYVDDPDEFLVSHTGSSWMGRKVAWDLETKTLDPWSEDGRIICMTISFDGKTGYYLPYDQITHPEIYIDQFLKEKKQIGANIKYDFRWLASRGVSIDSLHAYWDTVSVSKVINELQFNSLKSDAWIYTKEGGYDRGLDSYKKMYPACSDDYSLIPESVLFPYAVDDARITFQIYEMQEKVVRLLDKTFPPKDELSWTLEKFIRESRLPMINFYLEAEVKGVHINIDELKEIGFQIKKEIRELEIQIYQMFGVSKDKVNIKSQEQLGNLIESKGWQIEERSKKGFPLTNVTYLKKWKNQGHKEAELLLELREKLTLFSTFIGEEGKDLQKFYSSEEILEIMTDFDSNSDFKEKTEDTGFWKYIKYHSEDDSYRIHATFHVMMTDSGSRNRSSHPNLQNIPASGAKSELVRRIFATPSAQHLFGSVDFSGLQLRLLAMESGDEEMRKAFTEMGGDLHSLTAVNVFARDMTIDEFIQRKKEPKFDRMRHDSKGINFGLSFLMTARTFAKNSIEGKWTMEEALDYVEKNNLRERLNYLIDRVRSGLQKDIDFCYYVAVAEDISNKFFDKYQGLRSYLDETVKFATENGYSRSPYGSFRRLPYLYLAKTYGGESEEVNNAIIKNNENISVNTIIQNMEGVVVNRWLKEFRESIKAEADENTYVNGQIHDAGEFYCHKDFAETFFTNCKRIAEKNYPEYKGIPLEVEGTVADYYNGELWDVHNHSHGMDKYIKEEV